MILDFEAVGFDLVALRSYTYELTRLIVKSFLNELVNTFHYPEEIKKLNLDITNKEIDTVVGGNLVWDIDNGTLITVGEGLEVK